MLDKIFITTLLFIIRYSHGYENVGRLHGQHRVYPDDALTAIEWYYCGKGVKLCATDFKGYYVGCYNDEEKGVKYYHACPTGTRCGCLPDGICNRKKMCVPIDEPYPMKGKATFRFNGTTKYNYYQHEPPRKETSRVSGVVKQDASAGKFLQLVSHEGYTHKSFELIVPDANGNFTKYSGYSDRWLCKNTTIPTFEPFGADIKNHLLTDTQQRDNEVTQTWEYKMNYDFMSWITWRWKWVISSDRATKTSTPITTEYYSDGEEVGEEELAIEEIQKVFWETEDLESAWWKSEEWYTSYWNDDNNGDWFRVPEFCKSPKNEEW